MTDDLPLHAWSEGEPETAPPQDRPPIIRSERAYLLNPAMGFEDVVGPVAEGVQVGDTILCFNAKTTQQWSCRVVEMRPNLMALVERV